MLNLQYRPLMRFQSSGRSPENLDHLRAWYDYEIWQMDVKMTFLNYIVEEIFMNQPEGFTTIREEQKATKADSTTEAEHIAVSEASNGAVWMKNYIQDLGVVPSIAEPIVIFCDNNGAIAQAKELRYHHRSKHILRRYHLLRDMVSRGDFRIDRLSSAENITDPLTKSMSQIAHTQHLENMGLRSMGDCL
ncbi:Retrovirus-related Pol polyprotein from transposon TNT 1-94 [Sesamum angolense]|uniref:Retrovirus-related Pol polyprotein from transposon TNT 1-94 n=1 Tax=Sesamum angolense TaxID=2727404 RepID=A0AAE1T3E8_9LAMI|nr:Retrovirus-related Pol polyprotein from transposon TNT 1-94 [Sesamum angolense]